MLKTMKKFLFRKVIKKDSDDDTKVLTGVLFEISIKEDMSDPFETIETQAPDGYEIAEEITFIAKHGTTITMYDNLVPLTPNTGDDSNIVLWSGLSISSAMLLGIMVL